MTVLRMRGWGEKSDVGIFWPVTSRPGIIKDSLSLSGSLSLFSSLTLSRSLSLSHPLSLFCPCSISIALALALSFFLSITADGSYPLTLSALGQRRNNRESWRERELIETEKKCNKKLRKIITMKRGERYELKKEKDKTTFNFVPSGRPFPTTSLPPTVECHSYLGQLGPARATEQ